MLASKVCLCMGVPKIIGCDLSSISTHNVQLVYRVMHPQDSYRKLANSALSASCSTSTILTSLYQRLTTVQVQRTQAGAAGSIQLRILSRLQNQATSTAWESWMHFHRQHKACKAIASRIRNRGMASAFNAWKDRAAQLTRAKQLCQRVLGGSLRRCFSAWE